MCCGANRFMDLGIKGKVAVVLGASQGIGRACADSLAAEGAKLAIASRGKKELSAAAASLSKLTDVFSQECDATDIRSMDSFLAAVQSKLGRIDILVNNCGGPKPGGFSSALTEDDWAQAFERCLM